MASYQLPKPDGSMMTGVTLKDGILYGPSGKRLGPTSMFPDLQNADGKRVSVQTAPATDDEGNVMPENIAPGTAGDDENKGDTRTNQNGIKQKGMTLGGIKQFNEQYGLNLADGATMFNLSKLGRKDAYKSPDNKIETDDTGYTVGEKSKPVSGSLGGIQADTEVLTGKAGGYTIPPASVPGTTGHSPEDPQSGVSSAADSADQTRALSMKPFRGSERQREFADRPGNRPPVSEASAEKGNGSDKARNAYASAFLNSTAKGPMGVLREASAAQGVIRTNDGKIAIKDGEGYRTYTGDKSAREVAFDLGGGQKGYDKHADHFTSIGVPDKPEIKPDDEQTPATPWSGMTMDQKKGAVTAFAQDFANTFKGKLKKKD
jgi:hypothetical protein